MPREAKFEEGEKVLLFLKNGVIGYKDEYGKDTKKERLQIVGAWQGKFKVDGEKAINHIEQKSTTLPELEKRIKEKNKIQNTEKCKAWICARLFPI